MISVQDMTTTALRALERAGVPPGHARTQLSLLLDAELSGVSSHGLLRLPRVIERIANGVTNPETRGKGEWRGQSLWQVDGQQGLGPVVAQAALGRICQRARKNGVAAAAIRNCDHLGMLAWYAEQVAARGQILIAMTVSEALVHPWGGRHAMLGTNPIAIGVPAHPEPFVFDMATSLVSMGRIHDHANRDQPIPEGWALDRSGNPTTDAHAAKAGAIAPFGGAKGYALGLAFELLITSLTGAAIGTDVTGTLDNNTACNKGDMFIVLEPMGGMTHTVSRFLDALRESAPADPSQPVRIPGERARASRAARATGSLTLPPDVLGRIQALAGAPRPTDTKETPDAH